MTTNDAMTTNDENLIFATMKKDDPTPPECFRLEDLEIFQTFENQTLVDVNYYLWLHQPDEGTAPHRFLYTLELVFDTPGSLLLSSGDDSEAIRIITATDLLETSHRLQQLHGKPSIQRIAAGIQPLWREVVGKTLGDIRLSRNEAGLFLNDALLLDFTDHRILVRLAEKDGLLVGEY